MKKLDTNSLVAEFDVRNNMSWVGLEDDLSLISLVKQTKYSEINLEGTPFGKNMYDAGVFTFNQVFTNALTLFPVVPDIAFNMYQTYDIVPTVCNDAGMYFDFKGGSLTGNFAFENSEYTMLPKRFLKGFTFNMSININDRTFGEINDTNDGIFLFLGARAEDVTLVENKMQEDINGNLIAFKFNDEGKIGYKYIDSDGLVSEGYSPYSIKSHGWKIITITYIPEGIVLPHLAHCIPRRKGELCIYVNGLPYLTIPDFEEPMFRDYTSGTESSLGLPYSITIGGGSFGLKHEVEINEGGDIIESTDFRDIGVIGKHFGGNFYGGIQVVRLFDKHMLFNEVIERYNEDAESYGLHKLEGGRIIKYER
jgi:hypothetical protein